MLKIRTLAIPTLALMMGGLSHAAVYSIDNSHSSVGFSIRHLVSNVHGSFQKFSGTVDLDEKNLSKLAVAADIDPASIFTNEPKRDAHLQSADFFDVQKFPKMTFKSSSAKDLGNGKVELTGDLTMHGVTKPVTLSVSFLGADKDPWGNTRAGFSATGKVNRKDYGIVWNKTLDNGGVMVGDDVTIQIDVEAVKAK